MATWTPQNKSSSTWYTQIKGGQGWLYDQPSITYDALSDLDSGNAVLYDSLGTTPVWINDNKNSSVWATENKSS